MGRKEKKIINEVLIEGSKKGRLFRVNCGKAWIGETGFQGPGKIMLVNPRRFHGLPAGVPDVIGWESVEICEIIAENMNKHSCSYYENKKNDMNTCVLCPLHKKIAIFKAVEVKTGKGKLTKEQKNFKKILIEHGGIYEEKRD